MASKILVHDNGGYTEKVGYTTDAEPRIIPNCITKAKSERRRQFIGDQIDDCKDVSGLFYIYPFQKGYIVNWDVEKQVWDYTYGHDVFDVNFKETCLIVTEPYFNFTSIQENMTEILFEDYKFHSILRINAGTLSAHKYHKSNPKGLCCLVVDSGFSFTYIIPYVKGKKLKNAIRRINIGGKVLTNHLKDIISYRQLHVMDETYVMNQVKEDVCYVSTAFWKDMEIAKKKNKDNTIVRDYVLPDYTVIKRGYVRPPEETTGKSTDTEQLCRGSSTAYQNSRIHSKSGRNIGTPILDAMDSILKKRITSLMIKIIRMNNERFMVPEILFNPSDIGVQEMGIPEAIVHSIEATPEEIQPHLYENILLTGGNAHFPGYRERIYNEVRSLAPYLFDVNVYLPENPVTNAWHGGCLLSKDHEFPKLIVSRKQYEENGIGFCLEKFDV